MRYTSQIGQDKFVLKQLKFKRNGTFVDIGAGHPILINNTYVMEREYGWKGLSVDYGHNMALGCKELSDAEYLKFWNSCRVNALELGDALQVDFEKLFEKAKLPKVIDYLDIDICPPKASLHCLMRLPFDKYKFRVITFEHDDYKDNTNKEPSRKFLLGLGYKYVQSTNPAQEDWYLLKG